MLTRRDFLRTVAVGGIGLAAMGLVGCSSSSSSTSSSSSSTDTSSSSVVTETEQTEETVELTGELSISTWGYDTSGVAFQTVVNAYTEKNPGVTINVIDYTSDDYNTSLGVAMAAATSDPDVIFIKDAGTILTMADKNQLLPIDDYIAADNLDLSVYSGGAELLQYNGVSYALPFRNDWYVLYYNKDLFDEAGVEYPSNDMTWEEYYELAAQLTSGEGSDKVYGTHHHKWEALVSAWAVQDGEHTVVAEDYSFYKEWYENTLTLQDNGYMMDYATITTSNIGYADMFENQQCAMLPMGTYFMATLISAIANGECDDFNWGIAAIPHPSTTDAGYTVGSYTPVTISAYTDVPDLAWDFVKFATSEEAAALLGEQGVLTGIQTEESMAAIASLDGFPQDGTSEEALSYTHFVFDRPLDPDIDEVRTVLNEVHELIMIESYSVDDGIAELNERVAEIKGW